MYRIIDCNINRVCEGLRVLEDITRFYYNSEDQSKVLKDLRHKIRDISKNYEIKLLENRDPQTDIGPLISQKLNLTKNSNINSLIMANFKRVQEGLRTLEEVTENKDFEKFRYLSYQIEKDVNSLRYKITLPSIYGITFSRNSLNRSNIEIVKEMIKSGIKIIQYREKDLTLKQMLEECYIIRRLTKASDVTFIVNDHIDIAKIVDADGVHIGQDDLPIKDVRSILGNRKIIGLSTHSQKQALQAVRDGADYIGVGPIYRTKTKDNVCPPVGYNYLEWVSKNIDLPFVAVGGIKRSNLAQIIKRNAKSVALVSEITGSLDIEKTVKEILEIIKENSDEI